MENIDRPSPLILTLRFDDASFAMFDAARRLHFPPERNLIPAHLTLFHHLPGARQAAVSSAVAARALEQAPFTLTVKGLRYMGGGTAYVIESPLLSALRGGLAKMWLSELTPQDAQAFRPHVTIQNKVTAPVAKALFDSLSSSFSPFEVTATGLLLWRYQGGPWEAADVFAFDDGAGPGALTSREDQGE